MTEPEKRRFGGAQPGAGRPRLDPDQKPVRQVIYLPPDLADWLTAQAGDQRGAVSREILRIVRRAQFTE